MGVKDKVLLAAEELFAAKGYDKTSVQDIIDQAEVSKGGLYHHFDTKEAILDALLFDFAKKLGMNFKKAIQNNKEKMTIQLIFDEFGATKQQLPDHLQELYLKFLFTPNEIVIREKFLYYIREEMVDPMSDMISSLTDHKYPKELAYLLLGITEIQTRLPVNVLKDKNFQNNFGSLLRLSLEKLIL